ncbi:protein containing Outer membrane protein, OmpA/MotB [Candidatus Thiomargarita nelsonii]|uniref:Protein containing Outer membrane protein, OmpA/MotB n=1 Tax=Candidatus Thiomargarita nelsonii TaxID=1003181 RepID=A0A176RTE8_9GAMM|nr:protein containing Outer membrane protein, OmpA/MotB [Candidatus Thiomargarita nelsonii]
MENKRYAITEKGQILNKESLLLLYDKQQRERINRMIADCGWRNADSRLEGKGIFRNLTFDTGKATLTKFAKQQIKNLAAAFNKSLPSLIKLHGHTDSQGFRGISEPEENKRLNLKLSQQRAKAVKRELVAQGVYEKRIQIRGYGQSRPLVKENSVKAWAKNRRVEIESVD